jgi:hypothetical protein
MYIYVHIYLSIYMYIYIYIYIYIHMCSIRTKHKHRAMTVSQQKTAHETSSHNTNSCMHIHALVYLVPVFGLDYYPTCLLCVLLGA